MRRRNPIFELGANLSLGSERSLDAADASPGVTTATQPRNLVEAARAQYGGNALGDIARTFDAWGRASAAFPRATSAPSPSLSTDSPPTVAQAVDSAGRAAPGPGYWLVPTFHGRQWTNDPRRRPVAVDASGRPAGALDLNADNVTDAAVLGRSVYISTPADVAAAGMTAADVPGLTEKLTNDARAAVGLPPLMSRTMKFAIVGGLALLAYKLMRGRK